MAAFGISVALLTPFTGDGAIDTGRLATHAVELLDRGAAGVTLYGTTGEGASIGADERGAGLACLRERGVPAGKVTLGICASAGTDAVAQLRHGLEFGIRDVLLTPPFYFTGLDDAGLFDWHAQVLRAAPAETRFILYNIPQMTGVPLSPALVARLAAAFPGRLRALKDSSGDWASARAFLDDGTLPVLIGDERLLHRAVPLGCAGSISGVANLYPERLARLLATATEDPPLSAEVDALVACPVVPALKARLAQQRADPGWERVRPPLSPLPAAARAALLDRESREPAHG